MSNIEVHVRSFVHERIVHRHMPESRMFVKDEQSQYWRLGPAKKLFDANDAGHTLRDTHCIVFHWRNVGSFRRTATRDAVCPSGTRRKSFF